MSEHMSPIPSRIYNAAVGGHVCGPEDVDFGQKVIHLIKYDKSGNEVSFESQVTQANKIYVIHDDFTLSSNVTIPANCVLEFDGGSIANGTITGQNSSYIGGNNIFKNILITGTWIVPVIDDLAFDISTYQSTANLIKSINALQNENIFNEILINRSFTLDFYDVTPYDSYLVALGFQIKSNAKVCVAGTLTAVTNNYTHYSIFTLNGNNIEYSGGHLIGDVETHTGTTGEYGYGILIQDSKYVTVHDVICEKFWGDGICLGGTETEEFISTKCEDIYIYNVLCDYNRRQGLSICVGNNVIIENSKFNNTGRIKYTSPGRGIDIEPNDFSPKGDACENIVIRNCTFNNNYNGAIIAQGSSIIYNRNILIDNCDINNDGSIEIVGATDVTIRNCKNFGIYFSISHTDLTQKVFVEHSIITNGLYAEGVSNGLFDLYLDSCDFSGSWTKKNYAILDNIVAKNTTFVALPGSTVWHVKAYDCNITNQGNSDWNGEVELYRCRVKCEKIRINGKTKIYNCVFEHTYQYGCFLLDVGSSGTAGPIVELRNNTFLDDKEIIFWQITGDWSNTDFIIEQAGTTEQFSVINGATFDANFNSVKKLLLTYQ